MTRPHPLRDLYDREMRRTLDPPDATRLELAHLVRIVLPPPRMSYVAYSDLGGLEDAAVEEAIEGEIAFFRAQGGPFEWTLFAHDRPADLQRRLAARGFDIDEVEEVMVLDLKRAPPSLTGPPSARVRAAGGAELPAVRALLERVWGEDFGWLPDRLGAELEIPGYLRVFVAEVAGEVVSAAWVYLNPGVRFAGLYGGSTLPEHRGRGLYTDLLAARAEVARRAGYRYLTVDAGSMSRPIVARHGFLPLARAWPCRWQPPP